MKTHMLKGLVLGLFVAMACSPLYAQSVGTQDQPAQETPTEEMGYGFGAALASVFYIPAKFTYATLGVVTGGIGYALSGGRADVANNIIYPSVRGNWVVTPSHLKGTEPIYFVGAPPPEPTPVTQGDAPLASATTNR